MKNFYLIIIFFILNSCKNSNKSSNELIEESNRSSEYYTCDFKTIKEKVISIENNGIESIYQFESIIKHCIDSLTESENDSLYLLFIKYFYKAINIFNDSIEKKHSISLSKLENNIEDKETKDFLNSLNDCGLELFMTEGMYYVDVKFDYFEKLFSGKVSSSLNEFLRIRSIELKQGFSEDAILLISFNELYERVITWEKFLNANPNFFLKQQAQFYYEHYFSTLLTGMDNSRTFNIETKELLPEVKDLYEQIIEQKDTLKTTKIIIDYYELLKINGFKQPSSIKEFLNEKGLYSMLGIQPILR
jgi:tetratricopeptide (TPR) repeat protein